MELQCVKRHVTTEKDMKAGETITGLSAAEAKRLIKEFPGKFKIVKTMEIETKIPEKAPAKKRATAKK